MIGRTGTGAGVHCPGLGGAKAPWIASKVGRLTVRGHVCLLKLPDVGVRCEVVVVHGVLPLVGGGVVHTPCVLIV